MRELLFDGRIPGTGSHRLVDILLRGKKLDFVHGCADYCGLDCHLNSQQLIDRSLELANIEQNLREAHPVVALVKFVDPDLVFEVIVSHLLH